MVYAGHGDDNVTLGQALAGTGSNYVNLGEGNNTAIIYMSSIDNTIVGGSGKDVLTLLEAQNKFFGMDGDDVIQLDLGNTSLMANLNSASNTGIVLDAGSSGFNAGTALATALGPNYKFGGDNTGYGDTLKFSGSGGSIDFTSIDDKYIHGIERIDVIGVNATITLGYQDILQMTDYKNTLIIRADAGDTINFVGAGFTAANGFAKVGDDIAYNDNYEGTNSGSFDVYSNGEVTLLIEQNAGTNAANVTGLP
jgi:hypothetical protein